MTACREELVRQPVPPEAPAPFLTGPLSWRLATGSRSRADLPGRPKRNPGHFGAGHIERFQVGVRGFLAEVAPRRLPIFGRQSNLLTWEPRLLGLIHEPSPGRACSGVRGNCAPRLIVLALRDTGARLHS